MFAEYGFFKQISPNQNIFLKDFTYFLRNTEKPEKNVCYPGNYNISKIQGMAKVRGNFKKR